MGKERMKHEHTYTDMSDDLEEYLMAFKIWQMM